MSVQSGATRRSWSIGELVLAMLAVLTAAAIRTPCSSRST
jgi:hypothetical protein